MIGDIIKLFKKNHVGRASADQPDFPKHVLTLDGKSFDDFINAYALSVVDFWAPWCKPCQTMLPRLRRVERIYTGKVAFGRLNTQNERAIAQEYDIMSIPHFGFFHYGKKVGSVTGLKSVGDLKDSIDHYLSKYG